MVFTRIVQPGLRRKYMYSPGERTIFRIAGTIIPRVWPMMLLSTVLAIALCFIFDPLRRAERQGLALTKLQRVGLYLFRDMERVLAYDALASSRSCPRG